MFKTWTDGWVGEKGGVWRLGVTLLSYLAGMIGGGLAVVIPLQANVETLRSLPEWLKEILEIAPVAAGFLLGLALFFIAKAGLSRGRPGAFAAPGVRAGVGQALISGALWLALALGAGLYLGEIDLYKERLAAYPPEAFASLAGAVFVAILVQASSEEIVFRGYLLPRLSAWVGPIVAVIASGLVFLALHFQPGIWGGLMITAFGVAFAVATIRTGSVMAALGAHVANNFFEFLMRPDITNAEMGPQGFAATAAGVAVWLIVVLVTMGPKKAG